MLPHALGHVFWSMQGFAGLAVLAAAVPLAGMKWLALDRVRRIAGIVLLAASATTAAWGVHATHALISRFAYVDNGTPALPQKALPHLDRCAWTLTSAPPVTQVFFGHTSVWSGVDTPEELQAVMALARTRQLRGAAGFVVAPQHCKSPLVDLLDTLAPRMAVDDVLVYRLRL